MKILSITIFIVLICIDFNVLEAQTLTQTQITKIEKAITEEMTGIEEYRTSYSIYLSAMIKTRFEIKELIAERDLVMSRAVFLRYIYWHSW